MNFKRIQAVFLFAFIVIDIFLVMMTKNNNIQNDNNANESANSTVIKEMKRDDISVKKLSNQKKSGYYLSATQDNNLGSEIVTLKNQDATIDSADTISSTFRTPIKVDAKHPEKTINQLIKKPGFVLSGNQYTFNKTDSSKSKLVYDQKAIDGNFYTDDARITFNLNENQRLTGYTQQKLNDVKVLHEKADVISQERAVIYLYQYNGIPNNSDVVWAQLGYTKLLHINGKDVYIPTWIIATKNKSSNHEQIHRINAFSGASFKTEQVQNTAQSQQSLESVNNKDE
ncbi:two-component system regulatory protein YycI [Fructilactobacillus sp. Tb1]|uniref:two-component system regulatory protein YycI n=1 Tax=Fructilactobacillus sp. Tb1 TaxID=3422304 RepID=UPI003D2E4493